MPSTLPSLPSIYRYRDPVRYLSDVFAHRKSTEPAFTVRSWAREMEWDGPEQLLAILKQKKKAKHKHLPFLQKSLALDPIELTYFQAMISLASAETTEERGILELALSNISPGEKQEITRAEDKLLFSHWLHAALLTIYQQDGMAGQALSDVIGHLKTPVTANEALEEAQVLVEYGYLRETEPGHFISTPSFVATRTDRAHEGARAYYREVGKLANAAIDGCELGEREFQCFAFAVPESELATAKALVRQLRTQLSKLTVDSLDPTRVIYQANLQLFPLTGSFIGAENSHGAPRLDAVTSNHKVTELHSAT